MPHMHELNDFTVSAIILHPDKDKVCMVKHKKYGVWIQPGGHIELNEGPIEALEHELEEEAGLTPNDYDIVELHDSPKNPDSIPHPVHINVHNVTKNHRHIDMVFIVQAKIDKLTPQEGESQEVEWMNLEQIQELVHQELAYTNTLSVVKFVLNHPKIAGS